MWAKWRFFQSPSALSSRCDALPLLQSRLTLAYTHSLAIPAAFPVTPGYALIIPRLLLQQEPVETGESGKADEAAGPGMKYQFTNKAVSFAEVI